jgi:hypothetical protein
MDLQLLNNVQDSTIQQQPVIQIQRNEINFQSGGFQIDSSRLATTKVVVPVKKTIPFVPINDTIAHPVYNPVDNSFIIVGDSSLTGELHVNPVEPLVSEIKEVKPREVFIRHSVTVTDKIVTRKQIKQNSQAGFEDTDWMLPVIVVSFILFSWIRVVYGRFVTMVLQASYNYFTARRIFEESNAVRSRVFIFFNLFFFINIGLFASQCIDFFNMSPAGLNGISLFGLCFGGFFALYTIKSFLLALLDFIFLIPGGFGSYNFTVFLYNKIYGLLLLPVITVLPFVPVESAQWVISIGIGLFVLFYFFRILRGIQIGIKNRLSLFYLFLYLCALEILPLMLLYKFVTLYN